MEAQDWCRNIKNLVVIKISPKHGSLLSCFQKDIKATATGILFLQYHKCILFNITSSSKTVIYYESRPSTSRHAKHHYDIWRWVKSCDIFPMAILYFNV